MSIARGKPVPRLGQQSSVRIAGLPDAVVRAIEDLQRDMRTVGQSALFNRDGRVGVGIGGDVIDTTGTPPAENPFNPPDLTPPPAPTNLTALGGYAGIMIRWDRNTDRRIGYTEILRSATDNVADAIVVGTATGNIYSDLAGAGGAWYYWARNVNAWSDEIKSPLNRSAGTLAETAPDVPLLLEALTGAEGDKPFYTVPVDTVIDGVTVPAGVYLKDLYARAAVVTLFRAGLAVIDSASIIELTADKIETNSLIGKFASLDEAQLRLMFADRAFIREANIADLAVTSAKIGRVIQSDNWDGTIAPMNPGTQGWAITRDGEVVINNLFARGNIAANSVVAGASITAPNITGGSITGGTITGGSIVGATITGGQVISPLLRNAAGDRYLRLDDAGPYILHTPNAKILQDGSTQFSNRVASGGINPGGTAMWGHDYTLGTEHVEAIDPGAMATGVRYGGTYGNGWQIILIDTGYAEIENLAAAAVYAARIRITNANITWWTGAAAPAGQFVFDMDYHADVLWTTPFFVDPGQNTGTDPLNRLPGTRLATLALRLRPRRFADTTWRVTTLRITGLEWSIYRQT